MPGAYAHITLVNEASEPLLLESRAVHPEAIGAVGEYLGYCELGAVSPDYPYLAIGDEGAKDWADKMHYIRTGETIHAGVRALRTMAGDDRKKGLAWLFGYAAHVTTDVTIHPVVERKVGPYETNKTAHRICEMHQDAYIYQRLSLGGIQRAEHLDSGILRCVSPGDCTKLDPVLSTLWSKMLQSAHPDAFAKNPPAFDAWHRGFKIGVDKIAEEGGRLWPLARHVATDVLGLAYPPERDINRAAYIEALDTPAGKMTYDAVFDLAKANVAGVWSVLAASVLVGSDDYVARIGNWNLDTGKDGRNRLVFWPEVVA